MTQHEQVDSQEAIVVHTRPVVEMDDEQFFRFCQLNRDLRIERNVEGDMVMMAPEGASSGRGSSKLTALFESWSEIDGTGQIFASSTGFLLPNGAIRSPDVAWVRAEQLRALTDEQWEKFPPLCPDFVLELPSRSDSLPALVRKMHEYLDNGAELGWLLDPINTQVQIFRRGLAVQTVDHPGVISGEPVLPGFTLDVPLVWAAMERRKS